MIIVIGICVLVVAMVVNHYHRKIVTLTHRLNQRGLDLASERHNRGEDNQTHGESMKVLEGNHRREMGELKRELEEVKWLARYEPDDKFSQQIGKARQNGSVEMMLAIPGKWSTRIDSPDAPIPTSTVSSIRIPLTRVGYNHNGESFDGFVAVNPITRRIMGGFSYQRPFDEAIRACVGKKDTEMKETVPRILIPIVDPLYGRTERPNYVSGTD